jgi:hypothetical protein
VEAGGNHEVITHRVLSPLTFYPMPTITTLEAQLAELDAILAGIAKNLEQ